MNAQVVDLGVDPLSGVRTTVAGTRAPCAPSRSRGAFAAGRGVGVDLLCSFR